MADLIEQHSCKWHSCEDLSQQARAMIVAAENTVGILSLNIIPEFDNFKLDDPEFEAKPTIPEFVDMFINRHNLNRCNLKCNLKCNLRCNLSSLIAMLLNAMELPPQVVELQRFHEFNEDELVKNGLVPYRTNFRIVDARVTGSVDAVFRFPRGNPAHIALYKWIRGAATHRSKLVLELNVAKYVIERNSAFKVVEMAFVEIGLGPCKKHVVPDMQERVLDMYFNL